MQGRFTVLRLADTPHNLKPDPATLPARTGTVESPAWLSTRAGSRQGPSWWNRSRSRARSRLLDPPKLLQVLAFPFERPRAPASTLIRPLNSHRHRPRVKTELSPHWVAVPGAAQKPATPKAPPAGACCLVRREGQPDSPAINSIPDRKDRPGRPPREVAWSSGSP